MKMKSVKAWAVVPKDTKGLEPIAALEADEWAMSIWFRRKYAVESANQSNGSFRVVRVEIKEVEK